MKKIGLFVLAGSLLGMPCLAQDGYTISGKLCGVATSEAYVVTADFGRSDTLARATVGNDAFVLTGTVPGGVRMVNLVFAGVEIRVPLMGSAENQCG